jgi:hypothetical protein
MEGASLVAPYILPVVFEQVVSEVRVIAPEHALFEGAGSVTQMLNVNVELLLLVYTLI